MPQQTVGYCTNRCCAMCCAGACAYCAGESDLYPYPDDDRDEYDDDRPEYDTESVIQSHGYRPDPLIFYGDGPMYLGMELEIHANGSVFSGYNGYRGLERYARKVQEAFGEVIYIQEDGSVSDGFEVTSYPMSYKWAMEHFPWDVLRTMADDGCWTDRNVGLHVHVSRAAFKSECHLYRWMKFVHRNAEQVMTLARRRNSRWAPFEAHHRGAIKDYVKGPVKGARTDGWGGSYVDWDRYQAINPVNRDTLEVRVFRSSLDPSEVQAALAFVAASVEYTRDLDANKIIKERGWAWSSFVDWLKGRDEYRVLLGVLEGLSCVS